MERIIIIGAGPAGSLLGGLLARSGIAVTIYEKHGDTTNHDGRTISLSLSPRGLAALDEAGIGNQLRRLGITMRGRMFHEPDRSQFQAYARPHWANYAIDRQILATTIRNWALTAGVIIHSPVQCIEYQWRDRKVILEDATGHTFSDSASLVVGADGASSEIRNALARSPTINMSKRVAKQCYHEVHLTPGAITRHLRAIHIWPRQHWFLVAMPQYDQGLRGTLVLPTSLDHTWKKNKGIYAQITDAIPELAAFVVADDLHQSQANPITTITMSAYHLNDQAVVIGDAAHAMVPFLGQGVNIALQDAAQLAHLLIHHPSDYTHALHEYSRLRVPECQACASLSQANFDALLNGTPSNDDPVNGVVARVNFWRHAYVDVIHAVQPSWAPDM